jgi:TRAP-type mannitol/chloroaromatic compound transport system permease large subunit
MGLLALPAMLKSGYDVRLSAGVITAGGCLGILIPPSVLLIVYGATAGVSVVQLYAGAFFPGLMLTGLYIGAVIILSWLKPSLAPPLPKAERQVALTPLLSAISGEQRRPWAPMAILGAAFSGGSAAVPRRRAFGEALLMLMPLATFVLLMGLVYRGVTAPEEAADNGLHEIGSGFSEESTFDGGGGLAEPPAEGGLEEPPADGGLAEPPQESSTLSEPPGAAPASPPASGAAPPGEAPSAPATERAPAPPAFWWVFGIGALAVVVFYAILNFQRYQVYRLLLQSFVPLSVLILAVLGTIVFGFATPTEAAAIGGTRLSTPHPRGRR